MNTACLQPSDENNFVCAIPLTLGEAMFSKFFSLKRNGAARQKSNNINPFAARKKSYQEIVKSSFLIGGSTAINIFIGMLRTKAMAVMLGPGGLAVMTAYALIEQIARSFAQLGVSSSGVREIAAAVSSGDGTHIARTALILKRVSIACAILGAAILVVASAQISSISFGNDLHSTAIAWLSLALFCTVLTGGQGALLQGTRHIKELAQLSVLGGFISLSTSIPLVYLYGEAGVVPSMIVAAATSSAAAWWFSRKIKTDAPPVLTIMETARESSSLLRLGLAFMISGLLTQLAAYVVRVIVMREMNLDAAGMYQAAWTLGGLYIGFILNTLGTDFYPRLVGTIEDHTESNQLVNEQALVSFLFALPGVLLTITLSQPVIILFYSAEFIKAADILIWICLGMALRVISYPLGYIVIAKNKQKLFLGVDGAWTGINILLTWVCLHIWGIEGVGIAYSLSYVFHTLLLYPIARNLTGFTWTRKNKIVISIGMMSIAFVFISTKLLPEELAISFGLLVTMASAVYSCRVFAFVIELHRTPKAIARIAALLTRRSAVKR